MRKDGYLTNLADFLKHNPRKEGQSIEDRAMEVYQHSIAAYDALDAQERAMRDERSRIVEAARFYAFFHIPTRVEHRVLVSDMDAFSKKMGIPRETLIRIGEGETRDYKGQWVRANNLNAKGKPWKPPIDKQREAILKREREEDEKRIAAMNANRYVMPPENSTTIFNPNS